MATHVKWDVPVGTISAEPGAVFSGAYGFIIKLHGLAGHGSRPDLAHSVLDCFVNIYNHMNTLRMKYVSPTDVLTFSVGIVNCGTARNIVPDELTFGGSVRTFNVAGAGTPFMEHFMEIDIIFKIAVVGIIVTIICQILKKSDRDDIATIVSLAGLIIVLTVVLDMVVGLFDSIRNMFDLF